MSEATITYPHAWVSDRDFNPSDSLIKLKGRDYLPVQPRLRWFLRDQREMIASGIARRPYQIEIVGHMIDREQGWSRHHVRITDVLGNTVESTGSESLNDFNDYDEKSYTKALGRALALLGYATGDAVDFDEEHRIVDTPVERPRLANGAANNGANHTTNPNQNFNNPAPRLSSPAQPTANVRPVANVAEAPAARPTPTASPETMPANERQVASLRKLCAALHRDEPDFGTLTFAEAQKLLAEMSRAFSEARRAG